MEILISEIPEEGLVREGVFPESIFDLSPDDVIRPLGPVQYHAEIFALDGVITFSGWLRGEFSLQCSTCLEEIKYFADFDNWCSDLEVEEGQESIDLREVVREDFLLELPSYARCDEILPDRVCPKADLVEQQSSPDESTSDDAWKALDDWT